MTDLDIRDLDDDSDETKKSPANDRMMKLADIHDKPDKGTFIETEHSYRGGQNDEDDEDECIIEPR